MTMKFSVLILSACLYLTSCTSSHKAGWITTTENSSWVEQPELVATSADKVANVDVTVLTDKPQQQIEGFGACFNELGWTSLGLLEPSVREQIMEEWFAPGVGANFTICRMPVAANDFSRDWYSYNEKEGDFEMSNFSIKNDLETLIPFIKNAQKYQPDLRIWASPWCPPSWMKHNKHYAGSYTGENCDEKYRNGLPKEKVGREGTDMFIQEPRYLQAYALYFSKFIQAYKEQNINIFAVMPQNEFNSPQIFPSCTWRAEALSDFIGNYLGPAMEKEGVEVMFGTMERANEALVDTILTTPASSKFVKCVGFQWAGKGAIGGIHKRYPNLKLYQTEQECGDGKNTWEGAMYSWDLMRHYLNNGVCAYNYWNMSLEKGGISRWGWAQNSLVVVDPRTKDFEYSYEYYVMKHVSHFVRTGAYKLETEGGFDNVLAFKNEDGSIALIFANETNEDKTIAIRVGDQTYSPNVKANSLNTLLIP